MKKIRICLLVLAYAFMAGPASAQQGSDGPLTNGAVVKLVRAGFKEKTVVAIIRSRPNAFQLDPEHLIELKHAGVSENIILTMLSEGPMTLETDDSWSDDAFFRDKQPSSAANQGNSVDLFGSGSGSSSQTRGRGQSQGNATDTLTTGSATVRILRPPSEANGQPPKLEKTPTLTNESIVKLVEAGFSEGTIIKRIEDSPADFDIAPAKLDELRKRRVSDAIIAAMKVAMSGADSASPGEDK